MLLRVYHRDLSGVSSTGTAVPGVPEVPIMACINKLKEYCLQYDSIINSSALESARTSK